MLEQTERQYMSWGMCGERTGNPHFDMATVVAPPPAASGSRFGLFELTNPLSEEQLAEGGPDIAAIHGIQGDYEATWTHGQNGPLWLRDFLSKDLEGARVFSFGYDAAVALTKSQAKLEDFSRSLLGSLMRSRKSKVSVHAG